MLGLAFFGDNLSHGSALCSQLADVNLQNAVVKVAETEEHRILVLRDAWAPTLIEEGMQSEPSTSSRP